VEEDVAASVPAMVAAAAVEAALIPVAF